MFTRQNGILHSGAFSFFSERGRIPVYRIECFRSRVIFVHTDALGIRQRTDASDQRPRQLESALTAMAPMDEHPESCFVKPRFHSGAFSPSSNVVVHTSDQSNRFQPSAGTSWSYETPSSQTKATAPLPDDARLRATWAPRFISKVELSPAIPGVSSKSRSAEFHCPPTYCAYSKSRCGVRSRSAYGTEPTATFASR